MPHPVARDMDNSGVINIDDLMRVPMMSLHKLSTSAVPTMVSQSIFANRVRAVTVDEMGI